MAPTIPVEFTGQKESKKCTPALMMGNTKMLTKGNLSGFVPEYRHGVDTTRELEGFGSVGRFDTEMTASEDSFAPERKYISFNADGFDNFGVPVQILSHTSHSERKDLKLRLRMELDQVRALQRQVASLSSNGAGVSPYSDIRSFNGVEKKLPPESYQKSSSLFAPPGKKRVPPGSIEPHMKQGHSGRHQSVKPVATPGTSNAVLMKQCKMLLNRLMSHRDGWVFNSPVNPVILNLPDYFTIIKRPMDLGTVKSKIAAAEYTSPLSFAADVRLTFSNAMTYNPPDNDVHLMAKMLSTMFEGGWKSIEKKLNTMTGSHFESPAGGHVKSELAAEMPALKKKKITSTVSAGKSESVRRVMTEEEKQKLSTELEALLGELPDSIIDFLKQQSSSAGQASEDEIEIDIDALGNDTLFQLRYLLDDYLLEKQGIKSKAEPCEIELAHESGISNSSILPCKGGSGIDEDVDIVENDPPIVSYPPVEIEKDAPQRNSKCSSSSSSTSQSDTDSGSSSGSEIDGIRAPVPVNTTKDSLDSGANVDKRKTDAVDAVIADGMVNGLTQVEHHSQNEQTLVETDGHQEGESTPSERQVSPEKLYRAALLKGRFADTILKAREKTLEKGEKKDPEKLRIEREELERRQKEEKARLQAEAKAAEKARRKAETEAAAKARMKRELEREAARQALLKMEKTVEINENSQFMEDLEMLTTVVADPSSLDERSPECTLNDLGSFKLEGISNPLEQLGLYMKVDDEEDDEEEGGPQSILDPVNDVEEGEID